MQFYILDFTTTVSSSMLAYFVLPVILKIFTVRYKALLDDSCCEVLL